MLISQVTKSKYYLCSESRIKCIISSSTNYYSLWRSRQLYSLKCW